MDQKLLINLALILLAIIVTVIIYRSFRSRTASQDVLKKDTYAQLEIHRRVFPEAHPSDRQLLNVIYDNYLTQDGDLYRKAHITLKVLSKGFKGFKWRIPHLVQGVRPFGIMTVSTVNPVPFQVEHYDDKQVTEIWIPFSSSKPGDIFSFTIEYFQEHFATLVSRRFVLDNWQFDWVYTFVSPTDYFEMRVHFPKTSRINLSLVRNSLTQEEHISRIGDEIVYVSSHTNPGSRPASGRIPYQVWSPALPATISLISGLLLALPLTLLGQLSFGGSIAIFIVVSIGVSLVHRLTEKIS